MALPPPSMFEEGFVDPREPTLGDAALQPLPVIPSSPRSTTSFGSFRPLSVLASPLDSMPPTTVNARESIVAVPTPGVLSSPVDVSQYDVLGPHDWSRASIDYDGASPTSADSLADHAPTPPVYESGSFLESYIASGRHFSNPVVMQYLEKTTTNNIQRLYDLQQPFSPPQIALNIPRYVPSYPNGPDASHNLRQSTILTERMHPVWTPPDQAYSPVELQQTQSQYLERVSFPGLGTSTSRQLDIEHAVQSIRRSISVHSHEGTSHSEARSSPDTGSCISEHLPYESRDALLLRLRDQEMPYAEIKRRFGFHEAESTLRGRVRSLRKPSEFRVRKPVWTSKDIELLAQGEKHFYVGEGYQNKAKTYRKVPWAKVAQWMRDNGASYPFAAGPCAKKAAEVARQKESSSRKKGRVARRKQRPLEE